MQKVLISQYREIWRFLKANWLMIAFTVLLLVEVAVFHGLNTDGSDRYADYATSTESRYGCVFLFIFCENLKTAALTVAVGLIPLFLGPMFAATATLGGIVAALKYLLLELTPSVIFLCVLPHGIFEWSAILLTFSLSVILSKEVTCFCLRLVGLNSKIPIPGSVCGLRDTAAMTIQCWLLVVLPLLLAGAAMEVTLSPLITKFLLPPGG